MQKKYTKSLQQYVEAFLRWKSTHVRPATLTSYRSCLKTFVSTVGDKDMTNFGNTVIVEHLEKIKNKYAPATIAHLCAALRGLVNFCQSMGHEGIDTYFIRGPINYRRTHFYSITPDEYRMMLNRARATPGIEGARDSSFIAFLWDTGVRVSEASRFLLEGFRGVDMACIITGAKNYEERIVYADKSHLPIYLEYLTRRESIARSDHFFISLSRSGRGKGMTTRSLARIIERYRSNPKITCHSFRHGFASDSLRAGVQDAYLQKALGHRNPMSLRIYQNIPRGDVHIPFTETHKYRGLQKRG